jgi:hypothetical protein
MIRSHRVAIAVTTLLSLVAVNTESVAAPGLAATYNGRFKISTLS